MKKHVPLGMPGRNGHDRGMCGRKIKQGQAVPDGFDWEASDVCGACYRVAERIAIRTERDYVETRWKFQRKRGKP